MSPRTGRPKVNDPKAINFTLRLDGETNERLIKYCKDHSISRAEAIRQGIHLLLAQK